MYEEADADRELEGLKKEMRLMSRFNNLTEWQRYSQLFTVYSKCLFIGCMLQFF